jgi:hypothetical protein
MSAAICGMDHPPDVGCAHPGYACCRMHGGARGSGAPRANQNACKHGVFTKDAIAERRRIRAVLGEARTLLEGMK